MFTPTCKDEAKRIEIQGRYEMETICGIEINAEAWGDGLMFDELTDYEGDDIWEV